MMYRWLVKLIIWPVAQRELRGHLDDESIAGVFEAAFADHCAQLRGGLAESSMGGRLMVRFAALTIGLNRGLQNRGLSRLEANELTAKVTRRVYLRMCTIPRVLALVSTRSERGRVARATFLLRRFPFSAPSYLMNDVQSDEAVAFDVVRCPVAMHFRDRGLEELCVSSWCDLDFELASSWGATLRRSQTIAGGATCCDFRWHIGTDALHSVRRAAGRADRGPSAKMHRGRRAPERCSCVRRRPRLSSGAE